MNILICGLGRAEVDGAKIRIPAFAAITNHPVGSNKAIELLFNLTTSILGLQK
jgi:hypothetical protein